MLGKYRFWVKLHAVRLVTSMRESHDLAFF